MIPCHAMLLLALTTPVAEVEPNQTRQTATQTALVSGGAITGITRGFLDDPLSIADTTRDIWRLRLVCNPQQIQRHRLTVTTAGTQGHSGAILGLSASGGAVVQDSMVSLQNTSINTIPARTSVLYTMGEMLPTVLYRMTGSNGTTSPYVVTLTSESVSPLEPTFVCKPAAGPITITTVGRSTVNTRIMLFDGDTLAPIADAVNNDTPPGPSLSTGSPQSTLKRTLPAGRYLLAVGNGDTYDSRTPPPDDRAAGETTAVTESPGLIVNNSSTTAGVFNCAIIDRFGTREITLSKPGAYGVAFVRFTVTPSCPADIGTTGGTACSDGRLDNNDFVVFINAFFALNYALADVGRSGAQPGTDGILNNDDWVVYLNDFFSGCGQ